MVKTVVIQRVPRRIVKTSKRVRKNMQRSLIAINKTIATGAGEYNYLTGLVVQGSDLDLAIVREDRQKVVVHKAFLSGIWFPTSVEYAAATFFCLRTEKAATFTPDGYTIGRISECIDASVNKPYDVQLGPTTLAPRSINSVNEPAFYLRWDVTKFIQKAMDARMDEGSDQDQFIIGLFTGQDQSSSSYFKGHMVLDYSIHEVMGGRKRLN